MNLLDRIASYASSIGSLGRVVFVVSDQKLLTPKDMKMTTGSNWATFDLINGKPRTQYIAPKLRTVTFTIQLRADHGVKPRTMLKELEDMSESNVAYPLIIGGKPLAKNPFRVVELSQEWNTVFSRGELFSANVSLSLEEYV